MNFWTTVKKHWKLFGYLVLAIIYYFFMVNFYIDIGQDMGPENYLTYLLPTLAALWLLQYATGQSLLSASFLPHALTGLSWCIAFPLLYAWSYNNAWFVSKIRIDFLLGTGLFIFLVALHCLCLLFNRRHKSIAALFTILEFFCLLIPLMEFSYFAIYQHCLTPATLMALYLTNTHESLDFLQSKVGFGGLATLLAGLALFFSFAYWGNKRLSTKLVPAFVSWRKKKILLGLVAAMFVYLPFFLLPESSIITNWNEVSDYVHETQEYSNHYTERFDHLQLSSTSTLAQKAPGTVIMVIGESASRNFLKAYTPSCPYDNTPWLEQKMKDWNFVVFRNAYSCWVQTVPVLERALTEESQYNEKRFFESTSILDVAKKAGYQTYWFSNQGRYGQFDSAITLVAKTADRADWTHQSYLFTDKFDGDLLQFLPTVDPHKNNFIVLHIMGSHIYYNNRYPAEFEKWKGANGVSDEQAYANSALYTDYVLSQVYEYAKENLNLQAMIYYSDHGEDIHISHNPDVFNFDMVRIPMFIYLSDSYREVYPLQASTLRHNQNRAFTNDLVYDTVCGILGAPSNHYDPGQDFSSPHYRFDRHNLTTMLGQKQLTEDPYYTEGS